MKSLKVNKEILDYLLVDNQAVLQAKRAGRMNSYANHKDIFYEKIIVDLRNNPRGPSYYLPLTCFDKFEGEELLNDKILGGLDPKPLKLEQAEIMELIKQEMTISNCCIISAVTGFGKTRIMIELLRYNKGKRCLILMPTLILINQTSTTLKEYGIDHVTYGGKSKKMADITIMSMQGFRNMGDYDIEALNFDIIFIDECHKFLGEVTRHALLYLEAKTMYSFSATPYSNEYLAKDVEKFFGKSITAGKFNMIPEIFVVEYDNPYKDINPGEYTKIRFDLVDPDKKRLQLQYDTIVNLYNNLLRENIVVLYDRVEHTKQGFEFFVKEHPNIPTYYLVGELNEEDRSRMINGFTATGGVLFASDAIAGVGFDVPAIDTVCLFFCNKFDGRIIQMVGRALRSSKGKYDSWLIDFRESIFDYQYAKRKTTYKTVYKKETKLLKDYKNNDMLEDIFNF